jgi:acetylornithine deacetylase/succinyl-diaminopimelate desuccinylase-like protein
MMSILAEIKTMNLPLHSRLGKATLSPIWIDCDVKRPSIPHSCKAIFDRRTIPGENPEGIISEIIRLCEAMKESDPTFQYRITLKKAMLPFEIKQDDPLVKLMKQAGRFFVGKDIEVMYSQSFSSDTACLQNEFNIPTFGFGAGRIEDMAEEHVEIQKLLETTRIYGAFAYLYLKNGKT